MPLWCEAPTATILGFDAGLLSAEVPQILALLVRVLVAKACVVQTLSHGLGELDQIGPAAEQLLAQTGDAIVPPDDERRGLSLAVSEAAGDVAGQKGFVRLGEGRLAC